jgi:lysophospholipase L1-like esterase
MFLKKISTAILLFGSLSLNGQVIATELKQLPVHIGGRVVVHTNEVNENYYEYSWPGVYFETAFTGDSVTLRFNDDQNIFQLIVDGKEPVIINKPGKLDYPVTGLTSGKHKIRLEKITETQSSTGQFLGFYSDDKPAKLPKRNRQIEFIGDSYTVGYGNISTTQECSVEDVYKTTNSQLAFGPLVAKHFNADYQINAYSGFGVVRNYNGHSPEKNLVAIYPFTLNTPSYIYSGKWQPEVIVIGLGTNDFSTKLNAQEHWKSRTELQQDYIKKYVAFTKHLHEKNPDAQFILMASDKMEGEFAAQVQIVLEKLKASGLKKVDSIIFRGLDYQGCHWHPSVKDDQLLADMLIKFIDKKVW